MPARASEWKTYRIHLTCNLDNGRFSNDVHALLHKIKHYIRNKESAQAVNTDAKAFNSTGPADLQEQSRSKTTTKPGTQHPCARAQARSRPSWERMWQVEFWEKGSNEQ